MEPELRSGQSDQTTFSKDTKIEIIIPTLNEERTLGKLIKNIRSSVLPVKASTLVIDGGSTDRTLDICKRENLRYIIQKGKGKGSAMREAVEQSDADIVVFIDGDGTYCPSDLESILEPLLNDRADMVVGSRIAEKRDKGSISAFNTIGNKLFNSTINFAMKSCITDSLSGYRALYRKTFNDLILFSHSFEIEVEMTVEALAKGYRVIEIPISYGLRQGSKTKLDPLSDGIKIGRTLLFILMNVNPLKFFGIISLAFFVAGLYPGTLVLYEKITTGNIVSMPSVVFSSLLFVTGTISIVVGIVSELVVRSRRRLEHLINKKFEGNIQVGLNYFIEVELKEPILPFYDYKTTIYKQSLSNEVPVDLGGPEYTKEDIHMIDCVLNEKQTLVSVFEASKTQSVIQAMYDSARAGQAKKQNILANIQHILLGDNPFFGVDHLSQERARQKADQSQNFDNMLGVIKYSLNAGAKGMVASTHPKRDFIDYISTKFELQKLRNIRKAKEPRPNHNLFDTVYHSLSP